jgi:(p)ppGpp synthase/HD superfamily hydrolase
MKLDGLLRALPSDLIPADRELIRRAYQAAEQAHAGQTRA